MGIVFLLASISHSLSTRELILKLLKLLKDPYLCRRIFEKWIPWPLFIGLGLLVVGSLPTVAEWLKAPNANAISVALLSLVTGWYVNLNYISIHRYYRDRLMEAFMPCPNTDGKPSAAIKANKAKLSDMCRTRAPYHLINTNVILVNSDDSRWRVRGGDAFLLSPKYCGSTATGWRKTVCYMQKDPPHSSDRSSHIWGCCQSKHRCRRIRPYTKIFAVPTDVLAERTPRLLGPTSQP